MREDRTITRRNFLTSAAVGAAAVPFIHVRSAYAAGGERLRIAVVGTANQAGWNLGQITSEEIVGLCDVDANYLAAAGERHPKAQCFADYRKMLEELEKSIDAVLVATPDHLHGPAAAMALSMKKHVYCEKPLTHSVWETRRLAELAAENGLVTQMGTQIHASGNYRRVVELIRAGAIGEVREAHVVCGKSWSNGRFVSGEKPPAQLDWPLWQGPVAAREFSPGLHPGGWRRFWDYGTGTLGDMACHYVDLVHWALDLSYPLSVEADGPEVHAVGTPDSLRVRWEHPARGKRPPVTVTWYDGKRRPELLAELKKKNGEPLSWGDGQFFVGEKGVLVSNYGGHLLLPEDRFEGYEPPTPSIPNSIGHHREWIEACKNGGETTCNFRYSGALTETVLLGNVAFRTGKKLEWDAKALKATNCPEADALVHPEIPEGWGI